VRGAVGIEALIEPVEVRRQEQESEGLQKGGEKEWRKRTSSNGRSDWRKGKSTNGGKGRVGNEKEGANKGR
jgi:hypothetical protein